MTRLRRAVIFLDSSGCPPPTFALYETAPNRPILIGPTGAGSQVSVCLVPRISSFYGITVAMYFNDHAPPHIHVAYAGREASIRLSDLSIMEGELPSRAPRLVREWARLHAAELLANWAKARAGLPLDTIPGLE